MQALEVLVLRCSTAMSSHIEQLATKALQLVKYDPVSCVFPVESMANVQNYVDFDDDDDVDMEEEDGEDDYDAGGYSDDDDDSWKIRRTAAKLLVAIISTRIDLLVELYKTAAPVLIPRFSEREESVRLEVLSAFEALLKQTATARAAELSAGGRNKRKRSEEMDEDGTSEERQVVAHILSTPR